MLTSTMTTDEVTRALDKDIDDVYEYMERNNLRTKFNRRAIKHNGEFPISSIHKFKSKQRIEWTIQLGAYGKRKKKETIYAIHRHSKGYNVYMFMPKTHNTWYWSVFSSHYFKRYNERFLVHNYDDLFEGFDIVNEYLLYNASFATTCANPVAHEALRGPSKRFKQDEDKKRNALTISKDGVALGIQKRKNIFVYHTYISFDLVKEFQEDLVNSLKKAFQQIDGFNRNNYCGETRELKKMARQQKAQEALEMDGMYRKLEDLDKRIVEVEDKNRK